MNKSVFVSYNHEQGDWVWHKLIPCLQAGGVRVLIDRERHVMGKAIVGRMDELHDKPDMSVLILSPEYLASDYCTHEMHRAIDLDPNFEKGLVLPVMHTNCVLPDVIKLPKSLYVDLRNDKNTDQWDLLLNACGADLGTPAPEWINTRDIIVRNLAIGNSVNLVVMGNPRWRELINHIRNDYILELGIVDLQSGSTIDRVGLVAEILQASGSKIAVPQEPEDLVTLTRIFESRPNPATIALIHFDMVEFRANYEVDFFAALRYLITTTRKLILLIQSRSPFIKLLPADHPLSPIILSTVELKGRP